MQRPHAAACNSISSTTIAPTCPLYPKWQAFLRERQPKTIIFWGQDDVFFTPEGGEAYLEGSAERRDAPAGGGHFAVEDNLDYISTNMHRFYDTKVAVGKVASAGKQ